MKTRSNLLHVVLLFSALALHLTRASAWAQPLNEVFGRFQGDRFSVELVDATDGNVTGTIHFDTDRFPLKGRLHGSQVEGIFTSKGFQYPFTASVQGDELNLMTGGSVTASGPAGQVIGLGIGAQVTNPNSFLAAQARASGTLLVAPFSDPVTAVKNLSPQLSAMSQRQGGPALTLNNNR